MKNTPAPNAERIWRASGRVFQGSGYAFQALISATGTSASFLGAYDARPLLTVLNRGCRPALD